MKKLKQTLAWLLVLCMVTSFLPASVFAAAAEAPTTGLTTNGSPFQKGTGESNSFRIPALVTLSDGTLVAAADARWNTTYDGGGLDTMVAISKDNGATWTHSFANYLGDNGNEYNGASSCFIDPALAVLTKDENHDGIGEDTIYMLCDLYPNGVALNGDDSQVAPDLTTGFNASGNLKLTTMNPTTYIDSDFTHYLDGENIYTNDGDVVQGLTVDAWFNVTGTYNGNEVDSNLFFADSPFHVARTGYLYLTKSTDKGETWSAPQLLNLKTSDEMVCLVGPNGGMVTSNGVIVFPVYSYTGSAEYTSLIYSKDNGATWQRSASFTAIDSSEADAVELDNGNLRVFFRNESTYLCYADFDLTTGTWIAQANGLTYVNTQVLCNSNTELSVITYSQGVNHDGVEKSVILVSCPASANLAGSSSSDGSWRTSGRIFAGLVDPETYEMTWLDNSVAVTPVATSQLSGFPYSAEQGFFGYSSMTEQLDNGSVTILYEDNQYGWNTGDNYYYTIAAKTYTQSDLEKALGVTFGGNVDIGGETPLESYEKDLSMKVGQTITETVEGIYVPGDSTENDYVSVSWVGTEDSTSTTVTITAKKAGETTVELGNGAIWFNITIEKGASEDVQLKVNQTQNFTISGSNLANSIVQEPAEAIADMTVTYANDGHSVGEEATTLSAGQYLIFNTRASKLVNNTPTQNNNGRLLSGTTESFDAATAVWTITPVTGGYTIQDANGKYMRITNGDCTLEDSEQVLTLVYANETWTLMQNNAYLNQHGGGSSTRAAGWQDSSASTDGGSQFHFYPYTFTPASTTVSFTGKAVGRTTAIVGETTYNITVLPETTGEPVNVELEVGESKTLTDNTGNYENNISLLPDTSIATAVVTGSSTSEMRLSENVTAIESGKTYVLYNKSASKLMNNQWANAAVGGGGTNGLALSSSKDGFQDNDCWTITVTDGGYYVRDINGKYLTIARGSAGVSDSPVVASLAYDGTDWTIGVNGEYANNYGQAGSAVAGWNDINDTCSQWEIYEVVSTVTSASTSITFQGVAPGTTTAVVGNTLYNITVTSAGMTTVDIELEIGESFTYTDTTGNHVDKVTQQPDDNYATMAVSGSSNSVVKKLVAVTTPTFETGKRYVIENVRAKTAQPTDSVLSSTELTWGATGLDMVGPPDVNTSPSWLMIASADGYYISRDNEYVNFGDYNATMEPTPCKLYLTYVENQGWTIAYDGYYLADKNGTKSGEAFGTTDTTDGIYWNIYEVVTENVIDSTSVTFTGVAEGETTAIVGNTQYNITVVPAEIDDEVMNSATDIWTVDPEIQRNRYNTIINGKYKDLYTDESWKQYEAARQAAYKKLVEVTNKQYESKADAEAALAELKDLIDDLYDAADELESATTISIRYHLDTTDGTLLDIREYKVPSTANTLTLPESIVVDNIAYDVIDPTLDLERNSEGNLNTSYDVAVKLIGALGNGLVASDDINADGDYEGAGAQVADLVDKDTDGNVTFAHKITEMTLSTGVSYNLDLADALEAGQTLTWSSSNTSVATVDENGNVTAVGAGTTDIIATVTDANGNVVSVNSIPVTVFTRAATNRLSAVYIEEIENTTVYCVLNADTEAHAFEVIEGELIYGYFDTPVQDGTATTAFSFFGDPDEAHALVAMSSTSSFGDYYLLHDDDGNLGVEGNKYYVLEDGYTGAGYWQAIGLTDNVHDNHADWTQIKEMVQWAIDQGCDGGMGFTRRGTTEGNIGSNLTFISDPMPRIDKAVDGVLPTTRKQANYRRYVDDMVAAVHELVYFKITVTQEAPTVWLDEAETDGAIEYSDAWVKDIILPGAYLYTKEKDQADGTWDGEIAEGFRVQEEEITEKLNAAWTAEQKKAGQRVYEFYLLYEIQESDIPKFFIDNIANLDYNYESHYSTGAQAAAADAEARISVVGSAIDNVVIDFGQSFTYEGHEFESYTDGKTYTFTGLTNIHLKGAYVDGEYDADGNFTETANGSGAAAKYGNVKVYRTNTGELDDKGYPEYIYTVEYTPTAILQEADAVRIYGEGENGQKKLINGFLVYPATTVYYEEGFLENVSGWNFSTAKKATTEQTFELLGVSKFDDHGTLTGYVSNKKQAYGFDPIYDGIESDNNIEVAPSSISATTAGSAAKFTFTGTGFEIFANCTENSGYVLVTVKDKNGNNVKMFTVDTVVKGGTTGSTSGQTGNMDALPIVSLKDLEHGTYTVTLTKVVNDGKTVTIDGVRITNTVSDSSIYTVDLEDNPEFYQLRDSVMHAINIQDYLGQSMYVDELNEGAKQVLADISTDSEAPVALLSSVGNIYTGTADEKAPQDLLDNGPKNEIYLWPNQTLTFKVATQRVIQVGLKAPRTGTVVAVNLRHADTDFPNVDGFEINGATDMFYYLSTKPVGDITNTYLVSITNNGEDILAITDLKVCDDPSAAFVPLTLEDVTEILRDAGYTDSEPEAPLPFEDVPADSFYHDPVAWAVKKGITNGVSETRFGPNAECNRAQAVTFLWRAAGSPSTTAKEHGFVDVEAGSFYEQAVLWAVEKGITNGTDATHFSPNLTCSRAQVVTFLYRAFNSPAVENVENPFSDVPADVWYTAPVLWAVENGITNGTDSDLFDVNGVCNRAQIVTFLYRAYN